MRYFGLVKLTFIRYFGVCVVCVVVVFLSLCAVVAGCCVPPFA